MGYMDSGEVLEKGTMERFWWGREVLWSIDKDWQDIIFNSVGWIRVKFLVSG